jgi:hypothetical protein
MLSRSREHHCTEPGFTPCARPTACTLGLARANHGPCVAGVGRTLLPIAGAGLALCCPSRARAWMVGGLPCSPREPCTPRASRLRLSVLR